MKVATVRSFEMNPISSIYLIFYNAMQFFGWTYIAYCLIPHLVYLYETQTPSPNLYQDIAQPLRYFQVGAYFEVGHSILGLVKSCPFTTMMQVTSRVLIVYGVCDNSKIVQELLPLTVMIIAWNFTEIIRYAYYLSNNIPELKSSLLKWLRYSAFIIMYPIGVSCEYYCIWKSMPEIAEKINWFWSLDLVSSNKAGVQDPENLNHFKITIARSCVLAVYIYGFHKLYRHMWEQRRKALLGKELKKQKNM